MKMQDGKRGAGKPKGFPAPLFVVRLAAHWNFMIVKTKNQYLSPLM